MTVLFNEQTQRYEMIESGALVYAKTHENDGVFYIDYVEADPSLRGSGAAGRFMNGLMGVVREKNMKAKPVCSYAAGWLKRHSEFEDLVADI